MLKELENQNKAGYLKTPEQAELIESKGFEEGYQAGINDAAAGILSRSGIHNNAQVREYIDIYKQALYTAIRDAKGVYRLGESEVESGRLHKKITDEADTIFGQIVPKD